MARILVGKGALRILETNFAFLIARRGGSNRISCWEGLVVCFGVYLGRLCRTSLFKHWFPGYSWMPLSAPQPHKYRCRIGVFHLRPCIVVAILKRLLCSLMLVECRAMRQVSPTSYLLQSGVISNGHHSTQLLGVGVHYCLGLVCTSHF